MRDLPWGYHRDFQLLKPPLFRAATARAELLEVWTALLPRIEWDQAALEAASADEALSATRRALDAARGGVPFREAYRQIAPGSVAEARPGLRHRSRLGRGDHALEHGDRALADALVGQNWMP